MEQQYTGAHENLFMYDTPKFMILPKCFILSIALLVLPLLLRAETVTDKGREIVIIETTTMGKVKFNHHTHQENVKVCITCHKKYPQIKGIIQTLKNTQKVKPKKIMRTCRKCHKKMQKGPIENCEGCHHLPEGEDF